MLRDKIVEGMNAWSLDLAESITSTPETNIQLQMYTNLESRFTQTVPVTRILIVCWIFVVNPHVVILC